MRAKLRRALRYARESESGQSLIVIVSAMTVVLAVAALAIDGSSWMVKHHRAQIVADSAALAAANCLAHPGQASTIELGGTQTAVPACSSSTDSADAQTVAVEYAAANGLTITSSNVVVANNTVTVTAPASAPGLFAAIFGIGSSKESAAAQAGWTAGSSYTCTGSAAQCSAVYAGNTACPSNNSPNSSQSPQPGFQDGSTSGGATPTVNGVVHSEGGFIVENSGPSFNGTPPATVSGSCYSSGNMPDYGHATSVASQSWPVNYAASPYFTACTTNCITVNGIANVPPYCTQATNSTSGYNFTSATGGLPISGNVYCSIGSGTASNPATWNGPITIQTNDPASANGSCSGTFPQVTFIGGNVNFINLSNGGGTTVCLSPDLDNCLMYSTGNVNIYNGVFSWTGNIFAPAGTVQLGTQSAGGDSDNSSSGMLEAWNVYLINVTLNLTGDGPIPGSSSGGSSGGSDALLQ
jgi:hypothetical protein